MSQRGNDTLELLFDSVPGLQESRLVCEGLRWHRLPLPFALDHVNCWMLGEAGSRVLIDAGINRPPVRQHWLSQFAEGPEGSLSSGPEQVLITHFHPDHTGLAGWFAGAGSRMLGSAVEVSMSRTLRAMDDRHYGELYANWYAENGLPDTTVERVRHVGNSYRQVIEAVPDDSRWQFLRAGQSIDLAGETWQVLIGRGHAPDMLMLFRPRDHVLIAADQILPSISPNVSAMPHLPDRNPLQSFLDSLNELKALPEDTLVLPSHGVPFRGLHKRIAMLESHHESRLSEVLGACDRPVTAYDLFGVMFNRELDAQQTSFALGESLAHLVHLEQQGLLQRQQDGRKVRFCR